MIEDARERRRNNENTFTCEQCDYKSPSTTLLKKHIKTDHEEIQFHCDQCNYKAATKTNLIVHLDNNHKNMIDIETVDKTNSIIQNTYISKRSKCEICERKFNKEETYLKHKKQDHKENSSKNNNGVQKNILESMMTFRRTLRSDKTTGRAPEPIN